MNSNTQVHMAADYYRTFRADHAVAINSHVTPKDNVRAKELDRMVDLDRLAKLDSQLSKLLRRVVQGSICHESCAMALNPILM